MWGTIVQFIFAQKSNGLILIVTIAGQIRWHTTMGSEILWEMRLF